MKTWVGIFDDVSGPPVSDTSGRFDAVSNVVGRAADDWGFLNERLTTLSTNTTGAGFSGTAADALANVVGRLGDELSKMGPATQEASDRFREHSQLVSDLMADAAEALAEADRYETERADAERDIEALRATLASLNATIANAGPDEDTTAAEADRLVAARRLDAAIERREQASLDLARMRLRYDELVAEAEALDAATGQALDAIALPNPQTMLLSQLLGGTGGPTASTDVVWAILQQELAYEGLVILTPGEQELVDERAAEVRDALGDDWRGVTDYDMDRIGDAFEGINGAQMDAVVAQLSDDELQTLYDEMQQSAFRGGWSTEERQAFHSMVGTAVSLDTWRRLGQFTNQIDPDPAQGLPDDAREDAPNRAAAFDSYEYRDFQDLPLWGAADSPDPTEVHQGSIGDCYLITGLITLADGDPSVVTDLITENPNGTYSVTFADGSVQVVSPDLPVDPADPTTPVFGNTGGDPSLWVGLIEKAWAQNGGGYGDIVGGRSSEAIEALTGREAGWIDNDDIDITDLAERFDNGESLGLSTIDRPDDVEHPDWIADPDTPDAFKPGFRGGGRFDYLRQNHAYVVTGVDATAGTVTVVNPWDGGSPPLTLTEAELVESTNGVRTNEAP